ncbi:hypothetical protein NA78x_001557 [Anatilimnocola sp. NA78]|uniref:hypothetical protein n=1 Tax=Anatilimnocola sp. NA78 TaxID=3415683 RepID=UPI003CE49CC0
MAEPLNPYASPETPPEERNDLPVEVLRASFVVDDKLQWSLVRNTVRRWQHRRVGLMLVPICLLQLMTAFVVIAWMNNGPLFVAFIYGGPLVIGFAGWCLQRLYTQQNLRALQQHPILGATGHWQVVLAEHSLSVETSGGEQIWPLESIRIQPPTKALLLFWLEPDLPIAIPQQGDFGPITPPAFRAAIFERIGRYRP